MKKYLFLIACLLVATGCKKESDGPAPQQLLLAELAGLDTTRINNPYGTAEGVYSPDSNYLQLRLKSDLLKPLNWHLILNESDGRGESNLVVDLGTDLSKPSGTKVRLTEAQEKALMEGKYYVAAYSEEYPGGVIRGPLVSK